MDYTSLKYIHLIELFINYRDNQAYQEFSHRIQPMIHRICNFLKNKNNYRNINCDEFEGFIHGWIFEKNKLLSLFKKYQLESKKNRLEDEKRLVLGYCYTIIRSGFIEYLKEIRPEYRPKKEEVDSEFGELDVEYASTSMNSDQIYIVSLDSIRNKENPKDNYLDICLDIISDEQSLGRIKDLLLDCKADNRIPVWLTYLVRRIDLPEDDIIWLADLNDCTSEDIYRQISEAIDINQDKSFAVSSEFIGELMQQQKNTISVRVRRTIMHLESSLSNDRGD